MELVSLVTILLAVPPAPPPQAPQDPSQGYIRSEPTAMRTAPTQGLVQFRVEDRSLNVYVKRPKGEGTWPGVVLLHDAMGLSPQTMRMVDRLSDEGFVVIAPDLYGGRYALDADKGRELGVLMNEEEALGSIEALAAHLRSHPDVGDHRVGLVGFDLGGRIGLKAAMGSRDISALVVAYARPQTDPEALRRVGCPILGLFGGSDETIPAGETAAFRAALSAAGRTAEVKVFDGAGHGFMKDGDPSYTAGQAGEAWTRMVAFLKENL